MDKEIAAGVFVAVAADVIKSVLLFFSALFYAVVKRAAKEKRKKLHGKQETKEIKETIPDEELFE